MKTCLRCPDGRLVTLHWNSWIARAAAGFHGVNNCVTLSAGHILVSRHWITRNGLAHEVGHTLQAKRLGWRYLPWVLWGYLRHGYANAPAEREADAYMRAHAHRFDAIGPVPGWVR